MRKILAPSALLGLALLTATPDSFGQTSDRRLALGLSVSTMQYHGSLGSSYWKTDDLKTGGGVSFNYYLTPGLDLMLLGNYGKLNFMAPTSNPYAGTSFKAKIFNANLGLKLKLNNGWALKEDAVVQPYILLAPGIASINSTGNLFRSGVSNGFSNEKTSLDLLGALGINFRLSEAVGIFIQSGQHFPLKANFTAVPEEDADHKKELFLQHSVGLNIALGKAKDTDADGVSDRKDKCPGTPTGVKVDEMGCPLDGDKDGVPDYQDKCPTEAGSKDLEGCPDRDNDGVRDSEDACPDQAGKPTLSGCPDSDNDGVRDQDDKCPNTPAGTQVDAAGCPLNLDKDGDGVPDNRDKCPGTPAGSQVDSTGCRIIDPALFNKVKPVEFETNSTVIKRSAYGTLDNMIKILELYPEYSLRISGHADSRGTDEYNQGLSERRAASAKSYFTTKSVDPNRVTTEGFGESMPAAPNTSSSGMSKNRRVEFKFEFYIPSQPQP